VNLCHCSAAVVLVAFSHTAVAQSAPGPPVDGGEIVTDRPDVTEAAVVVPKGSVQIENGFTWSLDHGSNSIDLSESLVRVGIAGRTELRIGLPNYFDKHAGDASSSGFQDLSFGIKQQLGPLPGNIDLAVIVASSFPTGHRGLSSGGVDPFIKLPWSKELPRGWSVGGMQSLFWNTEDRNRNITSETTIYLERQLTKPWDVFVEYAGDYTQRSGSRQLAHFGTAYKITATNQFDFHFGFGLSHATPNHFFAVGYSFRLDGLWSRHR
jgi:hypothetical protein